MSYRNDHDAALARVDALQLELAQLKSAAKPPAPEPAPPIPPVRRGAGTLLGIATGTLAIGIAFAAAFSSDSQAAEPTEHRIAALDTRTSRATLDACIDAITPRPRSSDFSFADLFAIEGTAAPCRLEIRDIAREGLWSPVERDALEGWAAAEDTLANRIALIGVYQREDPARFDGGVTARQLWTEYSEAHAEREAAIAIWRGTY